eukprot:NODE_1960_length_525_cov_16.647059_g1596_i0.p1 GENE.NODE_1960_length_525_cov_16.647059_g1596_i0~~NODE_1960_length_525_cov_16.647059_g1596_i0.p1  ORF type:complete len:90 (-),score=10.52 NODE_1960_length_525_cov_16.647059_g1596_i0:47-316(-)
MVRVAQPTDKPDGNYWEEHYQAATRQYAYEYDEQKLDQFPQLGGGRGGGPVRRRVQSNHVVSAAPPPEANEDEATGDDVMRRCLKETGF